MFIILQFWLFFQNVKTKSFFIYLFDRLFRFINLDSIESNGSIKNIYC